MWLDSHCHLTADRFAEDRDEVIERAAAAGVDTFISIGSGYGVAGNADAVALADREARCWATAGVHPHEAAELDDALRDSIRGWLAHPKVVAVGECGLDYHYMNSPREVQREVFAWQVALARELDLPVSLHLRGDEPDAYGEALDIWRSEGGGDLRGVLHCYTGTTEFALRGLDAGLDVSFSGIVTFKRSEALRETARAIPLDRMLVETDAPFLAPEGHRGRRNEPAWVTRVGETLAGVHGVAPEELARTTTNNARRLFRLPAAS
ncbi:MAG: TatD family hydrolase [Myxococcota bacterium]